MPTKDQLTVADTPDIPALLADIDGILRKGPCGARARKVLRDAAAALDQIARALAERDALLAAREAQKPPAVAPTTTAYPPIVPRANGCISVWTPHRPGLSGVCDRCGQRVNQ